MRSGSLVQRASRLFSAMVGEEKTSGSMEALWYIKNLVRLAVTWEVQKVIGHRRTRAVKGVVQPCELGFEE